MSSFMLQCLYAHRRHDQTPCLPGTCCRFARPAPGAMELPRYQLSCVDTRGEARLEYEPLMRARRRGEFTLPALQAMMSSGSCAQGQQRIKKAQAAASDRCKQTTLS